MQASTSNPVQHYLRLHGLAVCCVLALLVGTVVILNGINTEQREIATIINLSGKQRMLSQRVLLLAHDLLADPGAQTTQADHAEQLSLLKSDARTIAEFSSTDYGAAYYAPSATLQRQLDRYIRAHEAFALQPSNPGLQQLKTQAERLLPALNEADSLHESQLQTRAKQAIAILVGLGVAYLLLLACVPIVVFLPALRKLARMETTQNTGILSLVDDNFQGDAFLLVYDAGHARFTLCNSLHRILGLPENDPNAMTRELLARRLPQLDLLALASALVERIRQNEPPLLSGSTRLETPKLSKELRYAARGNFQNNQLVSIAILLVEYDR